MATIERENMSLLTDKLTVKISKEDYMPAFEKKLKEYSKSANIPGFRKGMVPAGMIRKMYGSSIFSDEVLRTVEKELYNWLNNEKPEIFAQPLPMQTTAAQLDMNSPADYHFDFEIGLKPDFEPADLSQAKLTRHTVQVTDDMVQEEISRMQIKGGNMTEPETIDNPENVINVLFTQVDEAGNEVADGIQKENSVLLKYFTPAMQKTLTGKKVTDSFVFQLDKTFEGDKLDMMLQDLGFEKGDKEAAKTNFKASIVKIGLVEKRALEESFFEEIFPGKGIKTEAELRKALREEIQQYWNMQSANQVQDQIFHYLVDHTQMEFPASFLKRWLQNSGETPKTAEEAEQEYPNFSNQLKWTLISDKLINDKKIEVSQEEMRESMKAEVMRYFGQMNMGDDTSWLESYIDRMMKDEKQVDATYRRLITTKLFENLEKESKSTDKTVTAEELMAMQHHHAH